jgi:NADH-quinone oxidoreductase subunit G
MDWEGRSRSFARVLDTPAMTDARVLDALALELGVELGVADVEAVRAELAALPQTTAIRPDPPAERPVDLPRPGRGEAILATWHHLIDLGTLLDGDDELAGTARTPVVRLSKARAAELGVAEGDAVTVGTDRGALTLPLAITDMPDAVVWLPTNSPGSTVRRTLGVPAGSLVTISAAEGGAR